MYIFADALRERMEKPELKNEDCKLPGQAPVILKFAI
jgi:hypothetical protein